MGLLHVDQSRRARESDDEDDEAFRGFFDLTEEKKRKFQGTHVFFLDQVRHKLQCYGGPDFFMERFSQGLRASMVHSPNKPTGFSELCLEYTQRIREVGGELLKRISKRLGLEEWYINKTMDMDSGLQVLTANLYLPYPQPEYAMGMPPHSYHNFLTLLILNGIGGL